MKLSKIAEILNIELNGADVEITAINSLQNARQSELSYCDSDKNEKFLSATKAAAVLVKSGTVAPSGVRALECENPHLAFAILSAHFAKPLIRSGGHVSVGDFAQIAARGGISKDLAGGKNYAGHPIMELSEWFKLQAKIVRFFKDKKH